MRSRREVCIICGREVFTNWTAEGRTVEIIHKNVVLSRMKCSVGTDYRGTGVTTFCIKKVEIGHLVPFDDKHYAEIECAHRKWGAWCHPLTYDDVLIAERAMGDKFTKIILRKALDFDINIQSDVIREVEDAVEELYDQN